MAWKIALYSVAIADVAFGAYMRYRQNRALQKHSANALGKEEHKDSEKRTSYNVAKLTFSSISSIYGLAWSLVETKYNWTHLIYTYATTRVLAPSAGVFKTSAVFTAITSLIGQLQSLPISYWSTFVLEEKFGFNKTTYGRFVKDEVLGCIVSTVVSAGLFAVLAKVTQHVTVWFPIQMAAVLFSFMVVLQYSFPALILPLFNKFTPLEEGKLRTEIEKLAESQSFPSDKIYVIDGSTRSSHSNAFFVGLPGYKQICLYDTLLKTDNDGEILAILSHELGHWKMNHIPKALFLNVAAFSSILALAPPLLKSQGFFTELGFGPNERPPLVALMVFFQLAQSLFTALTFIQHWLSQTNEYQADAFAAKLGRGKELIAALATLDKENLGAEVVDPIYSVYARSHPVTKDRFAAIEKEMAILEESKKKSD